MILSKNKFGKYTLLERIAVGGMAEVYRGKLTGEKGFEKQVVIKKMLPHIAVNEEMIKYFVDEAKLAALLQHENIVHIYDFGEFEGSYYLAMEYLLGQDLNAVLTKTLKHKNPMSMENNLWITSKICDGLAYAHTLKDLNGNPLKLIHRDLSPHNVFITYDGKVKILDFGIAKTTMQSTKTKIGVAKGKMAYMSPEQLEAKTIDHRSDIFAIGILLYEMVTQSRMVTGDNTVEIINQIMNAEYEPPENRNPDLAPQVISIIKRALHKNPDDRYQSCFEMQTEIEDSIFQLSLRPSTKKLSEYVITLFSDDYAQSKEKDISKGTDISVAESNPIRTMVIDEMDNRVQKTEISRPPNKIMSLISTVKEFRTFRKTIFQYIQIATNTLRLATRFPNWISQSQKPLVVTGLILLLLIALPIVSKLDSHKERKLLKEAEACIDQIKLSTAKDDCISYYHNEILKLNPNSKVVQAGHEKIALKYAYLAEGAMKQVKIDRARQFVAKGLELKPDDKRLLALKNELSGNKAGLFFKGIGKGFRDAFR